MRKIRAENVKATEDFLKMGKTVRENVIKTAENIGSIIPQTLNRVWQDTKESMVKSFSPVIAPIADLVGKAVDLMKVKVEAKNPFKMIQVCLT